MSIQQGRQNNQAVAILNEVTDSGMTEARTKANGGNYSANFGTVRRGQRGKCIVGNASAYVDFGSLLTSLYVDYFKFEISFTVDNTNSFNGLFGQGAFTGGAGWVARVNNLVFSIVTDNLSVLSSPTLTDGKSYTAAFIYLNGTGTLFLDDVQVDQSSFTIPKGEIGQTIILGQYSGSTRIVNTYFEVWGVKIDELDSSGNFVQNLLHHKLDAESTTKTYDSGPNKHHGTIQNYYSGFWGAQNIKSYQNDDGYSDSQLIQNKDFTDSDISMYVADGPNPSDLTLSRNGNTLETEVTTLPSNTDKTIAWKHTGTPLRTGFTYNGMVRYKVIYTATAVPTAIQFLLGTNAVINRTTIANDTWYEDSFTGVVAGTAPLFANVPFPNHPDVLGAKLIVDYIQFEEVKIPRDESDITKDVLGWDLQYKGLVPTEADWVNSGCFEGDSSGYADVGNKSNFEVQNFRLRMIVEVTGNNINDLFSLQAYLATSGIILSYNNTNNSFTFTIYNGTGTANATVIDTRINEPIYIDAVYTENGTYINTDKVNGVSNIYVAIPYIAAGRKTLIGRINNFTLRNPDAKIYSVILDELDSSGNFVQNLAEWSLGEPIIDATNHTYFDKSGNGNHARLVNGSLANYGRQNEYHDLMVNGFGLYGGFNGSSSYGDFGINPAFNVDTDDFSFGISFVPTSGFIASTALIGLFGKTSASGTIGRWHINSNGSVIRAFFGGVYSQYIIDIQKTELISNKINHINVACDRSGNMEVFLNGISKGSVNISAEELESISNSLPVSLGMYPTGTLVPANYYTGLINSFYFERAGQRIIDVKNCYTLKDESGNNNDGINLDISKVYVPASSADPTKDALGNPLTHPQDGKTFLDCETEIKANPIPRWIQADQTVLGDFWFDGVGNAQTKQFNDFQGVLDNGLFVDTSESAQGKLKNFRTHKQALTGRQLETEKRITNN